MKTVLIAAGLCCPLLLASVSRAGVIGIGDFSGSEDPIDFTGIDVPATLNPITVGDLTMDSSTTLVIGPDVSGVWAETPLASGGAHLSNRDTTSTDIQFQFANPVRRVGMWINGGNEATDWTFSAFDAGGGLVGSHVFVFNLVDGYPDPSTFAGIEFATPFTTLTIVETINNSQYTSIDDIRFEQVPEPSSFALLGIGALIVRRRCRS